MYWTVELFLQGGHTIKTRMNEQQRLDLVYELNMGKSFWITLNTESDDVFWMLLRSSIVGLKSTASVSCGDRTVMPHDS